MLARVGPWKTPLPKPSIRLYSLPLKNKKELLAKSSNSLLKTKFGTSLRWHVYFSKDWENSLLFFFLEDKLNKQFEGLRSGLHLRTTFANGFLCWSETNWLYDLFNDQPERIRPYNLGIRFKHISNTRMAEKLTGHKSSCVSVNSSKLVIT